MKINKTIFLLALAPLCFASGCKDKLFAEKKPLRAVSVVRDITDPDLAGEDPKNIVQRFSISDQVLYEGMVYRGSFISSEDRPVTQITIRPVNFLFSEQYQRAKELRAFRDRITEAIGSLEAVDEKPKKHSMVVKAIAREINALAKIQSEEKVLICMSDLLESTESFSYYSDRDFAVAKRDPAAVAALFQRMAPLEKSAGIVAYLLYQPKDYEAQKKYDVALKASTLWLEGQGIKVIASPNLIAHE